jgi:transcription-repair coupling factor (superfamily II helicase)
MEMLEKVVAEMKGIQIEEEFEPSIRLKVNAFIPEDYISDITLRLSCYRKIASCKSEDALKDISAELEDRFGKIPKEVANLIDIMQLKLIARKLLITRIHDSHGKVSVLFSHDTKVAPQDIFTLREKTPYKMRFLPDGLELDMRGLNWNETYKEIRCLFTCLTVSDTFNKI